MPRAQSIRILAAAMGVKGTEDMSQEEYRKAAVDAVRKLAEDVGIPKDLKGIVKEEDIPFLAESAMQTHAVREIQKKLLWRILQHYSSH